MNCLTTFSPGRLIEKIEFILNLYTDLPYLFSIGFIIFLFLAGRKFAKLYENKVRAFIIGNIIWTISFAMCFYDLYIAGKDSRNYIVEGIAQYYAIGMIPIGTKIGQILQYFVNGKSILILSYIFIFIIFSLGFSSKILKSKSGIRIATSMALLIVAIVIITPRIGFSVYSSQNKGSFIKEVDKEIVCKYSIYSTAGFVVSPSIFLNYGRVDWQIINPKGDVVFKGYNIEENEKVYVQLTYPQISNSNYNIKREVKSKSISYLLKVEKPNLPGRYILSIRPSKAEGTYSIYWLDNIQQ